MSVLRLTIRELKAYIREAITVPDGPRPEKTVISAPHLTSREAIKPATRLSMAVADEDDVLAPHLRDADEEDVDIEDVQGPVPRTGEGDPYLMMDPYHTDIHPMPSKRFSR